MTNTNHFNEQVTGYDKHGNITGLKRYGQTGQSSYGLIDDLSLTYNRQSAQESEQTAPQVQHTRMVSSSRTV